LDLGLKFDFMTLTMEWDDGTTRPMRDVDSMTNEAFHIHDPDTVAEVTDHVKKAILDAKYEKADLAEAAQAATHLPFRNGTWRSTSVPMQIWGSVWWIARKMEWYGGIWHWATARCTTISCKSIPDSSDTHRNPQNWGGATVQSRSTEKGKPLRIPTFITPKKDGSVWFISDFWELNKRIKRKTFPIPKIQDMLLKN
jgi:hypothetical protein